MDFQKCNKLSLREKKSFNTILKHLVNQKMIDETFANEGRKIFGIQVGGGSSAEGIHANLNTNTSAKGPEFVEGMDPNQLIRDVAVAATEGMQLIRNASSSGSGGMGGSGGSGADSQSNNIVNAQVNNMQVVLSGIGQGRSAAELALFNPDPAIRAWGLQEISRQAEFKREHEKKKQEAQQKRMNKVVGVAEKQAEGAMVVHQQNAAARNLVLTHNINNKRILAGISGACFVGLASVASQTLEPFKDLAQALVDGLVGTSFEPFDVNPDTGWKIIDALPQLINFIMMIISQCANGLVWGLGLIARVFAGIVASGHMGAVVAILLFGLVTTIILTRLYDSNISFWTPAGGASLTAPEQQQLAPQSELASPVLLRDIMQDARQGNSAPQQILDRMPQQPINPNAGAQVERLALENGRLQQQLLNAPRSQQPALRNQIDAHNREQQEILQLLPPQQSLQLRNNNRSGRNSSTKSSGNNNLKKGNNTKGGNNTRGGRRRKRNGKKKKHKTRRRKKKTKKRKIRRKSKKRNKKTQKKK